VLHCTCHSFVLQVLSQWHWISTVLDTVLLVESLFRLVQYSEVPVEVPLEFLWFLQGLLLGFSQVWCDWVPRLFCHSPHSLRPDLTSAFGVQCPVLVPVLYPLCGALWSPLLPCDSAPTVLEYHQLLAQAPRQR